MQRKILLVCTVLKPDAAELLEEFWKRRKRSASELQTKIGKWSVRWATQTTNLAFTAVSSSFGRATPPYPQKPWFHLCPMDGVSSCRTRVWSDTNDLFYAVIV